MAVTINNQASVSYDSNGVTSTAISNLASTVLQGPLTITKDSMESTYKQNSALTYILSLTNSSSTALSNVVITDNLGSYSYQPETTIPAVTVTPLTYTGPARYYLNGEFVSIISPTVTDNQITFTITSLAANSNAIIIYDVAANSGAQLEADSTITNTASVTATGITEAATDTNTVTVDNYANVDIVKSMSPNPVSAGEQITYTFTLYNYGNLDADTVVLTDTFTPQVTAPLTVAVDGTTVQDTYYTYTNGTLTLPSSTAYGITVPAATITQSSTGVVSVSPGTTVITVSGII